MNTEMDSHILASSENTNNENRERELLNMQTANDNLHNEMNEDNIQNDRVEACGSQERVEEKEESVKKVEEKEESVKKIENHDLENEETENETSNSGITEENKNSNTSHETQNTREDYAEHVKYNDAGEAIYTDPNTNCKYRWSEDKNDWEAITTTANSTVEGTNPYETEHYRWCTETNQWVLKNEVAKATETENEFYKWDSEKNQWIPKIQSTDAVHSFEDGVHTYRDPDGTVYFWDIGKNAWFPKIDDEFMARYQLNYGFIDNTTESKINSISEANITKTNATKSGIAEPNSDSLDKNQSSQKINDTTDFKSTRKRKVVPEAKWFDIDPEHNTKVYVSNLPEDITEQEFLEVMSKCGLVMKDPQTQKYKIKLYSDSNGQLKGDGLCDYIKIESVDLALNLLDGYDIRGHKIKVQRAKFQMRGEYNPALKPKKKKKDKEKLQKMKERLFDWRPEKMRGERSKHERIVIIKNLFDPELFDKEVQLIIEYQNDLREECSKYGTVKKVVIFDRHPDGVAQVTMSTPEEADMVVQVMNRRYFSQRRLLASIWDGKTKYKIAETDAEIQQRIDKWDKYLEGEDKNEDKHSKSENQENSKVDEITENETKENIS